MVLQPYLFFIGNTKEAMSFYQSVFGGDLHIIPFTDGEMAGKTMHAHLQGGAINLMASDSTRDSFGVSNISLSMNGTDEESIKGYFRALSVGATEVVDIKKEVWGDQFGSLTDSFGIDWMANITSS
jgi:PhnB protein